MRNLFLSLSCHLAFAVAVFAQPGLEDPPRPTLVLDTGAHSAQVRRVAFTPDGQLAVTASRDKSIRVWDVATGETVRLIRFAVGADNQGMIQAMAISPDGRHLAAATLPFGKGKYGFPIYIAALETGRIVQVLKGHGNTVVALAFSPDGSRLASGASDNEIAIWDAGTWKFQGVMKGHTDHIRYLSFSPDGSRLASVAEDKSARIWSVAMAKTEHELVDEPHVPRSIAWSPDGKTVAVGNNDGTISIWEPDGKRRTTLSGLRNHMVSVSFTPDSKEILFTGFGHARENSAENGCSIVDLATGKERIRFNGHTNTVMHGAISSDGKLAITAGGNNNESFIWRTTDASIFQALTSRSLAVWTAGWSPDGTAIAWGNTNVRNAEQNTAPLQRLFDLEKLQFGNRPPSDCRRAVLTQGKRTLELTEKFEMVVKEDGRTIAVFRGSGAADRVYSFTWVPDGKVLVTTAFRLHLFDPDQNKIVRSYFGFSDSPLSIALSPDGRKFVSACADMTIRVWDLEERMPLLSLFVTGQDWIAWTEGGLYAASPNGERLMGWAVNTRGAEATSTYYAAAQFRKSLYHPDIVRRVISAGGVTEAVRLTGKKPGDVLDVSKVLPPTSWIASPTGVGTIRTAGSLFEVKAVGRSVGDHPVTSMRLLVNGRPYAGEAGVRKIESPKVGDVPANWKLDLPAGLYTLAVVAESAVSRAVSPPVQIKVPGLDGDDSAAMNVLAVGINDYPEPMKLRFAAPDADAISSAFSTHAKRTFKTVEVKVLKDQSATKADIEKGLEWLAKKMTHRDVAVVSFSGHGSRDARGDLYLITADVNPKDVAGTCLSAAHLKKTLAEIPGRVVVVLDACHSGAAADRDRRVAATDDLVRDLITEDYGVVVMSSSLGREFSLEDANVKQGYFTKALVEGLAGQADSNRDGLVYLNELDNYATMRVRQLSRGIQNPVTAKPQSVRSFALSQP